MIATIIDPALTCSSTVDETVNNGTVSGSCTDSGFVMVCRYFQSPSGCDGSDKRLYVLMSQTSAAKSTFLRNDTDPVTKRPLSASKLLENRPFLKICEMTAVTPPSTLAISDTDDKDWYGSFLVGGRYIVSDGRLYTMTPVDPLYWLIRDCFLPVTSNGIISPAQDSTCYITSESPPGKNMANNTKNQWQPLHQVLISMSMDDTLLQWIDICGREQLKHFFVTMKIGVDDDDAELYYKFSIEKVLVWLTFKQKAVEKVLRLQLQRDLENKVQGSSVTTSSGAFSTTFTLSRDQLDQSNLHIPDINDSSDTQLQRRCYEESIQLVCHYLTDRWREQFLFHLQVDHNVLLDETERKSKHRAIDKEYAPKAILIGHPNFEHSTTVTEVVKKQPSSSSSTPGAKRLMKASTKGMKTMSSFFTTKKSKTS